MYLEYCEYLLATTPARYQSVLLTLLIRYRAAFVSAHILDTISVRSLQFRVEKRATSKMQNFMWHRALSATIRPPTQLCIWSQYYVWPHHSHRPS